MRTTCFPPGYYDALVKHMVEQHGLNPEPANWYANIRKEQAMQDTSFVGALLALKGGLQVRRSGWNGKGMFITLQRGYPEGIPINHNTAEATGIPEGTVCRFLPYLMMCTVDGSFVPWLASQTDLLSDDWELVD